MNLQQFQTIDTDISESFYEVLYGTNHTQIINWLLTNQWWSGSALKTGLREVPGSIPGLACRPSRSKFFMVFSETRVNTG